MDKNELLRFVESGKSQREIAVETSRSQSSVKHWLKKYGLKTQWAKHKDKNFFCRDCGDANRNNAFSLNKKFGKVHKSLCNVCQKNRNSGQWRTRKQGFVDYKGGKCEKCDYNKCLGGLCFHHRDPKQKDPEFYLMKNRSLQNAKEELDKCDLLCRNCHAETHWELKNN